MHKVAFLSLGVWMIISSIATTVYSGERVVIADDKLSFEVPDGWKKSELHSKTTLGGWQSVDKTASVYFQKFQAGADQGMEDIMDTIIEGFEAKDDMKVSDLAKYKTGQVKGPGTKKFPAIYTTLDITLETEKDGDFKMRFYVFVVDTGTAQYTIQANTTMPIRKARENQIMGLVKSLVARK